ncbi:PAS domain S-box protein [Starkeya koreensis]|uniref:histidine kinase n=1 Tax=Ancylobacter koreensis TaxID=266121 RepID=A0ABT0DQW5_9HYPH|nr:MHYT domain-containing protein [Ancylobacter koreensis]MCK0209677.1 PAS domain S-box protein [Ancylobacter koreensis]
MNVTGSHDLSLVALSILIAVAASYTALDLAGRLPEARGRARDGWLAAAALVLGGGIWAMHFIAMLALHVGAPVSYDIGLTSVSFLLAVVATGIAFFAVSRVRPGRSGPGWGAVALSGVFMGLGIVGMHYTGMAAMRMAGGMSHDMLYVGGAIVLAVAASTVAVWLAFHRHSIAQRAGAALALGLGIAGMHYVAMWGVTFTAHEGWHAPLGGMGNVALVSVVTAATFAIFVAVLIAAMYDRRFAVMADRESAMLRASEERYRTLYRRTPLPLHSLDGNGCIEQVSDRWLDLLGYRRDEVIGRPLTDFMTPDSSRRRNEEHWPQLVGSGELREAEYRLVTKDGRVLDCKLSAVAERDAQGNILKTSCGLIDVTEHRAAEEALRQAQKLEAVGQLTGGIAHDFNNLLAVVLGNLELAAKRSPSDARLQTLLDNAIQAAQRGAALTQRMLAFARRQDLRPEPVNVPDLVLGMAEMLRRSIGPSVRIETRFPLGLPQARVDANQLELALLNLAVNARDAMPEGGTITIAASERMVDGSDGAVDHGALRPGRYFCLSVADTGTGMDEETLSRAAEPFFTTKGIGKGTGLGLAMVHGLAAQSGGQLVMESRAGQGTTATIYLPIADAPPVVAPVAVVVADEMVPAGNGGAQRVLVVDDDPLVLSATGAMLEDLECLVTEASSGEEALRILESGVAFDVVLTDQAMPGMTGVQLAAAIAARWPDLPVILGTGYAELPPDARAGMMRLGKPFSRDALRRAVIGATRGAGGDNVVPLSRHA